MTLPYTNYANEKKMVNAKQSDRKRNEKEDERKKERKKDGKKERRKERKKQRNYEKINKNREQEDKKQQDG